MIELHPLLLLRSLFFHARKPRVSPGTHAGGSPDRHESFMFPLVIYTGANWKAQGTNVQACERTDGEYHD
jgi:hypothetical protein